MASDATLKTALGLSAAELTSFVSVDTNKVLVEKLRTYISACEAKGDPEVLQAQLESAKINHERQLSDLEKRAMANSDTLSKKNELCIELQKKVATLEKSLADKNSKLEGFAVTVDEGARKLERLELLANERAEDVRNKDESLSKRQAELDRERDSSKKLFDDKLAAEKRATTAVNESEQLQVQLNALNLTQTRNAQQISMLKEQLMYSESQLSEQIESSRTERRELSAKLAESQRLFDDEVTKNNSLQVSLDSLRDEIKHSKDRLERMTKKADDLEANSLEYEKQTKKEIENKSKLTNLYKKKSDGLEANVAELTNVVAELQKLRSESESSKRKSMEELASNFNKAQSELTEKKARVDKLEDELRSLNIYLNRNRKDSGGEDPNSLFPTASLASSKIDAGLTLTEIFAKLIAAEDSRNKAEIKAQKLEQDLTQILREFELKAPELRKQADDLDDAESRIVELTSRLQDANSECQHLDDSLRTFDREKKLLEREKKQLEGQVADLSQQVQSLLIQLEELRSGRKIEQRPAAMSDAGSVISSTLVTVASITEMQEQNGKLRALVRELSEQREAEERARSDAANQELQHKLDDALGSLEKLRGEREKQEDIVKAIVRQRDMFKTLYHEAEGLGNANATIDIVTSPDKSRVPTSPGVPRTSSFSGDKQLLQELQTSFEAYRTERSKNDEMIASDFERVRSELDAKRLEAAKMEATMERLRERASELELSLTGNRKERENIQDRFGKVSALNAGLEQRLRNLDQELIDVNGELRRCKVQLEHTGAEKNLVTASVSRLELENQTLRSERSNQMQMMTSMNSVLATIKRDNEESTKSLISQRDDYRNEATTLRKRLDDAGFLAKSAEAKLEKERDGLRDELTQQRQAHHETRESLVAAEVKNTASDKTIETLENNLAEYKRKLNSMIAGEVNTSGEKEQLERAIEEGAELKKQLRDTEMRIEQFKQISSGAEKALVDLQQNQTTLQKIIDEKEAKHSAEISALKTKADEALKQLTSEKSKANKVSTELAATKSAMQHRIADHEKALAELKREIDQAKMAQSVAESDSKRLSQEAAESMDKYQKEVVLHAGDVEALKTAQEQRDAAVKEVQVKATALEAKSEELVSSKSSWNEQKRILEERVSKEAERISELRKQNENFHVIIKDLKNHITNRQTATGVESGFTIDSENLNDKTVKELLEVIEFEKSRAEIAQTEAEGIRIDLQSVEGQVQHLERQLSATKAALERERERNEERARDSSKYEDLMKKLETFNLLQDSNRLLRSEQDRTKVQIADLTAKCSKLEETLNPLKDENRRLDKQLKETYAQRDSLENDVKRWKNRTVQLKDQYSKDQIDPDEHKKLVEKAKEFEALKKEHALNMKKISEATALQTKASELGAKFKKAIEDGKKKDEEVNRLKKIRTIARQMKEKNIELTAKVEEQDKQMEKLKTEAQTTKSSSAAAEAIIEKEKGDQKKELETVKAELTKSQQESAKKTKMIVQLRSRDKQLSSKISSLKVELQTAKSVPKVAPPGANQKVAASTTVQTKTPAAKAGASAKTTSQAVAAKIRRQPVRPQVTSPTPKKTVTSHLKSKITPPAAAKTKVVGQDQVPKPAVAVADGESKASQQPGNPVSASKTAPSKSVNVPASTPKVVGQSKEEAMRSRLLAARVAKRQREPESTSSNQVDVPTTAVAAKKVRTDPVVKADEMPVTNTPAEDTKAVEGGKRPREGEVSTDSGMGQVVTTSASKKLKSDKEDGPTEAVVEVVSETDKPTEESIPIENTETASEKESEAVEEAKEVDSVADVAAEVDGLAEAPAADEVKPTVTEPQGNEETAVPDVGSIDAEAEAEAGVVPANDEESVGEITADAPVSIQSDPRSIVRSTRPASLSLVAPVPSQSDASGATPLLDLVPGFEADVEQVPSTPVLQGTDTLPGSPRGSSPVPVPSSRVRSSLAAVASSVSLTEPLSETEQVAPDGQGSDEVDGEDNIDLETVEHEEETESEAAVPEAVEDVYEGAVEDGEVMEEEETVEDDATQDDGLVPAASDDTVEAPAVEEVRELSPTPVEEEVVVHGEPEEPPTSEDTTEPIEVSTAATTSSATTAAGSAAPAKPASTGFKPVPITAPVSTPDGYPVKNAPVAGPSGLKATEAASASGRGSGRGHRGRGSKARVRGRGGRGRGGN